MPPLNLPTTLRSRSVVIVPVFADESETQGDDSLRRGSTDIGVVLPVSSCGGFHWPRGCPSGRERQALNERFGSVSVVGP